MSEPRDRDDQLLELCLLAPVALLTAATGLFWSGSQLAALLTHGRGVALTAAQVTRALMSLPSHPGDPAAGYVPDVRTQLGGPLVTWVSLLLVSLCGAALALLVRASIRRLCDSAGAGWWRVSAAGFASRADIRDGLSARAATRRTRHGQHRRSAAAPPVPLLDFGRDLHTRQRLFGSAEDSYLYLGPPRSGKGVHLVIPHTLSAPGAALVTATRPDTLRHTLALRAQHGPVAVFDPQQLAGRDVPRLRWAPQHGCTDPLTAIGRARALAAGAKLAGPSVSDSDFWQAMTEAVLRCYLHAAALDGLGMREVLDWTGRPTDPTPVRILRHHRLAAPGWAEELTAQADADNRQRDSVWAGVRRALDSLADPRVLDACTPERAASFDPAEFVSQRGTIYLLGSTGSQLSVAPLVTALVEDLVDTARRLGAADPSGRLTPPLTLVLDEAANIAPLPSLPNLLADGGGSGITTLCVLQSLAQARARWGDAGADAIWDAATLKVILGGLAHADDLHRISRLAGEIDRQVLSRSHGPGGISSSTSPRRLPALPPELIRTLPSGHALLLARRTPPVHAQLTPWWRGPHANAIQQALDEPSWSAERDALAIPAPMGDRPA